MSDIAYTMSGPEGIERIKELWEALNSHHYANSVHFKDHFAKLTFAERGKHLHALSREGNLRIITAERGDEIIGYCAAALSNAGEGEIHSIFVREEFRGTGVADAVMEKALAWLDDKGAATKILHVAAGNERAFRFYARHGFYPRFTMLSQKTDRSGSCC